MPSDVAHIPTEAYKETRGSYTRKTVTLCGLFLEHWERHQDTHHFICMSSVYTPNCDACIFVQLKELDD